RLSSDLPGTDQVDYADVLAETRALVESVLDLGDDIGAALLRAFKRGLLDVPFCLHNDNRGLTQGRIDQDGRLRWAQVGKLPLPATAQAGQAGGVSSAGLLRMLRHTAEQHDRLAVAGGPPALTRDAR